ncbi:MAG: serine protease, partial [Planctomycetota bacterium]
MKMKKWIFKFSFILIIAFWMGEGRLFSKSNPLLELEKARKAVLKKVQPSVVAILVESQEMSLGPSIFSGVILDRKGHIVTLGRSFQLGLKRKYSVITYSQKKYSAKVVAYDPLSKIGILKIKALSGEDLTPVEMGDSSKVEKGDFAISVGNPFGLLQSCCFGTVSGVHRLIEMDGLPYPEVIQITSPINPGDMGGLVANAKGQMIGLMATSYQASYGRERQIQLFQKLFEQLLRQPGRPPQKLPFSLLPMGHFIRGSGISFVLPSNLVKKIATHLLEKGEVSWGVLGLKATYTQKGILVREVKPKGPADKGGLKKGDLIQNFNGKKLINLYHL